MTFVGGIWVELLFIMWAVIYLAGKLASVVDELKLHNDREDKLWADILKEKP